MDLHPPELHASVSGFLITTGLILALGILVSAATLATAQRGQAWFGRRLTRADSLARLDLLALGGSLSQGRQPSLAGQAMTLGPSSPAGPTRAAAAALSDNNAMPDNNAIPDNTASPRAGCDRRGAPLASGPSPSLEPSPASEPSPAARPSERRDHKRYRTCFLGTLHNDAGALATNLCDILDLSATGARIRPVDPMPAMLAQVTVGLERLGRFPARVVWRHHGEVGLRFERGPKEVMAKMCGLIPAPDFDPEHGPAAPSTALPAH